MSDLPPVCPRVYCTVYCLSVRCLLSGLLHVCPLFTDRLTACLSSCLLLGLLIACLSSVYSQAYFLSVLCLLFGLLPVCYLFTVRRIACLSSVYFPAYCLFRRLYSLFPPVCLTSLSVDSSQCVANLHTFSLSPDLSVSACTLPNCAGGIV